MGVQQLSAPTTQRATSPPAGNKGRRPTTLSVNNSSSPSKTSPTKTSPSKASPSKTSPSNTTPNKSSPTNTTPGKFSPTNTITSKTSTSNMSPTKSTPSKSSPSISSPSSRPVTSPTSGKTPPKKNGVGGKGSQPPGKPTTTVCHAPVLATEARSKVRPCGCHGAGHHGTGHHGGTGHHQHQASTPTPTTKEVSRKKSKPSSTKKTTPPTTTTTTIPLPHPQMASTLGKAGSNRYVSTLLWVPRVEPQLFSTTLIVSQDRSPTLNEVIYVKSNGVGERRNLQEARKH